MPPILPFVSVEDLEDEIRLNEEALDRCGSVRPVSPEAEQRRLERMATLQRWDRDLRAQLAAVPS